MVVLNIPVVPFYTEVAGRAPLPSLIEPGELALNLTDRIIYSKKVDGTVVIMGAGASGGGGGATALADLTDVTVNSTPTPGQVLTWNSVDWVPGPVLGGVTIPGVGTTIARYWRITGISVPGGGYLDLQELHLRLGSTIHAATVTSSSAPLFGNLADLVDGSISGRNYWDESTAEAGGFWIAYDLGTAKQIDGLGQCPAYANRGISRCTIQFSPNGTAWTSLDPIDISGSIPAGVLTATPVTTGSPATYVPFSVNRLDDVDTSTIAPTTGNTLVWNGTLWAPGTPTTTADLSLSSIDALADVITAGADNSTIGRALVWDGSKWVPGSRVGTLAGGYLFNGLDDVEVTGAEAGSFLYFNGTVWAPSPKFELGAAGVARDYLIPMTGGDGSTAFSNLGPTGGAVTRTGTVAVGASAGKFGGGGGVFRSNGYLQVAGPALPGDFVISGWTRIDARPNTYEAIFELGSYTNGILFRGDQSWINGQNIGDVNSYFPLGVYTHWLWSKTGGTVRLFIGGALIYTGTGFGTVNSGAGVWRIGADTHAGGSQPVNASMGWFAMTIGSNGGFTAPFTPLPSPPTGITGVPFGLNALSDVVTDSPAPATNQALVWSGTNWVPGNPTVGGTGRAQAFATTPSIGVNAGHILTITGVGRVGVMIRLKVDGIAWLTVYTDIAAATADSGRSITTDPSPGSGVVAEAISTNTDWIKVTPAVGYFNLETPTVDALYVRVVNKDTAARAFRVDLEVSRTEP